MTTVREIEKKINIKGSIRFDEPMKYHTTFQVGGPAEVFVCPLDIHDLAAVLQFVRSEEIPHFILGGGANILVADKGIKGLVIDITRLNNISHNKNILTAMAGAEISLVSEYAAKHNLSGMEFCYKLPGSVGGAVWMNARCYSKSISDILLRIKYIDEDGNIKMYVPKKTEFSYKSSPFQHNGYIILEVEFAVSHEDPAEIWEQMNNYKCDRVGKGHFLAPSAGSVFKNNRAFGNPSGVIIDKVGLRGLTCGGAKISDWHANIIINTGNATASDIKKLIDIIEEKVYKEYGFTLEPEVLLIGEWED